MVGLMTACILASKVGSHGPGLTLYKAGKPPSPVADQMANFSCGETTFHIFQIIGFQHPNFVLFVGESRAFTKVVL